MQSSLDGAGYKLWEGVVNSPDSRLRCAGLKHSMRDFTLTHAAVHYITDPDPAVQLEARKVLVAASKAIGKPTDLGLDRPAWDRWAKANNQAIWDNRFEAKVPGAKAVAMIPDPWPKDAKAKEAIETKRKELAPATHIEQWTPWVHHKDPLMRCAGLRHVMRNLDLLPTAIHYTGDPDPLVRQTARYVLMQASKATGKTVDFGPSEGATNPDMWAASRAAWTLWAKQEEKAISDSKFLLLPEEERPK